ncbi:MarR family transcriptional regulator [Lachnospiraceae bacterium ASD3451]|uniref:MarR family winged helix-turn-helix transcriptional regulator n=1 Tax=Diplocloster agilis TaxID=2850323 RepID=UPI001DC6882E|nr:MarR family transcriptional regulator [Diplocloster agilis]MBU9745672.1 MarR family transcriptional regulator [Diplocloster agilis]
MKNKDVGHEIHAISNLIGRKIEEQKRNSGIEGITPIQSWILRFLQENRNRDVFQKDVEQEFSITRSTVTGILKLMEKNGFIRRISVPEDARLKKLVITDKGEAICLTVYHNIRQMEELLVRGMTPKEVDTMFELLEKVKKNLM